MNVAYHAFKSLPNNSIDVIYPPNALFAKELTNDYLFFVYYAQTWCSHFFFPGVISNLLMCHTKPCHIWTSLAHFWTLLMSIEQQLTCPSLPKFHNTWSTPHPSLSRQDLYNICLLYTSPSPRDQRGSRMPSSA